MLFQKLPEFQGIGSARPRVLVGLNRFQKQLQVVLMHPAVAVWVDPVPRFRLKGIKCGLKSLEGVQGKAE
jgi:hypothetical protein